MSADLLTEIFKIYKPQPSAGLAEYRAYYEDNKVLYFSTEQLDLSFIKINKEIFDTNRPDLFYIDDGKICKKIKQYNNKLQLKLGGSTFVTIKSDMQWLVPLELPVEKEYWDVNV